MNNTDTPNGTWQDLIPTLKPASAIAKHPKYGDVDIMKHHKNGKIGIRYFYRRIFTTTVWPHELTNVTFR